ncbi:MAG: hypothetical protein WC661_17645 [Opitutaceae bacterium]|jgi:hypothetical protein
MYPQPELNRLAYHKIALRRRIALRRVACSMAAARVARPLEWLDRALAFWRKLAPFAPLAALPLGLLATRAVFSRHKILGALLRWGPLVFGAVRGLGSAVKAGPQGGRTSRSVPMVVRGNPM